MVDFQCKRRYGWEDFLEIMRLLRAPGGCPWDAEQTHQSIRRNFLEESYEAVEAIDEGSAEHLQEELGDVLLQVALHAEMERELKEAEAKWAQQIAAGGAVGDWYWPVPNYYGITSYFGGRYLNGRWDNHTGTDIGVPQGVEIHAAQSGVVTLSRYNPSYGNYCIISHGNGRATLYAHQRQLPLVKVGDTVQKGQVIGYVGNTGNSFGAHLHFELRVNGVRGDVLRLYPGMTFTSPSGGTLYGG